MLRVGIVGAGLMGCKRAQAIAACPETRLDAVADKDALRARAVAEQFGCTAIASWEELVVRDDLDIVVVSTSHQWLAPVSLAALESGKHVLCEKPLALGPEEAEGLVKGAERNDRKLKTGFNHRYHPAVWQAHKLVSEHRIGSLLFARCRYGHGGRAGYDKEWRANPAESGGGELMDQGVHALDLFRWFLGEFTEVYACLANSFWSMPVEDNAFCVLRTASGQIASLHASWTQWKNLFSFEVFGDEGYVTVNGLGGSYGRETLAVGRRRPEFGAPEEEIFEFDGPDRSLAEEWKGFVAAIRDDQRPVADGFDGWQALRLVEAAYRSNEERRALSLPEGVSVIVK